MCSKCAAARRSWMCETAFCRKQRAGVVPRLFLCPEAGKNGRGETEKKTRGRGTPEMRRPRARASAVFIGERGGGETHGRGARLVRHDGTRRRGGAQSTGEIAGRREAAGLSRMREAQRAGKNAWDVPNGVVRCREKKARGLDSESGGEKRKGARAASPQERLFPAGRAGFSLRSCAVKHRKGSSRHATGPVFCPCGMIGDLPGLRKGQLVCGQKPGEGMPSL